MFGYCGPACVGWFQLGDKFLKVEILELLGVHILIMGQLSVIYLLR